MDVEEECGVRGGVGGVYVLRLRLVRIDVVVDDDTTAGFSCLVIFVRLERLGPCSSPEGGDNRPNAGGESESDSDSESEEWSVDLPFLLPSLTVPDNSIRS
jgi:hypothetical protein